jgi:DNA-3-methyladenine glycosylase
MLACLWPLRRAVALPATEVLRAQQAAPYASRMRLQRSFYARDTITVARELLGKHLVHVVRGRPRVGRIVEVEAYLGPRDLAAHSSKGLTPRTRVMFGPPARSYVYLVYGMHHCFNVVTGEGCAVLLRALEPVAGLAGRTDGPGRLCKAMAIDRRHNDLDLLGDRLHVAAATEPARFAIVRRPRVGVDYARHWARRLLRFSIAGNAYVSGARRDLGVAAGPRTRRSAGAAAVAARTL